MSEAVVPCLRATKFPFLGTNEAVAVMDFAYAPRASARMDLPTLDNRTSSVETLRAAVQSAAEAGDARCVGRLLDDAFARDVALRAAADWSPFREVAQWPDAWLVAAVRQEPPDERALNVLVERYWKPLFGRCQMLTLNQQKAGDLAQDAWCRILRARQNLKPSGNFPAYLMTIATNLWRDANRSARRAGALAEHRLASLDAALTDEAGESLHLADLLPDLNALEAEAQAGLRMDLDQALARLSPLLHDVLVARFLNGDSCAEIGRRYGRTEQTISGWVRQGMREMKQHLEETGVTGGRKEGK